MANNPKYGKHLKDFDKYLTSARREFEEKFEAKVPNNAQMKDFLRKRTLGTGSFGQVLLVTHKRSKKPFAMKVLEKEYIVQLKQVEHTISEIKLLYALNFEFVVRLDFFFKDNVYLYLVMPFVNGGEMFSHLRSRNKFDENLSRFYAAQVILAFEYFHFLGVVYRDLKPENILLCRDGYLKITDLGFCKRILETRTWTLCGTPEYLAPEIIMSKGYNFAVDWWALGVLIYEMNAGFPPFFANEPIRIYEKIVAGQFNMPGHFSKALKDLVPRLLQTDRTKRFGNLKAGARDIKGHQWFAALDWDAVLNKMQKPPFAPKVAGDDDSSNFENFEDQPLRSGAQNEYGEMFDAI
ncbi:hypothetical protein R5R35_004640 [Gryllus longicercus]|uniref:cAMP-dependent protein kinase n=1 Tax=Gryllus longicercus TaxID=2509291 RepID=A0AAN9ZG97_9ORTH